MEQQVPIVRHVSEVTPVPCPCGESRRIITTADGAILGLHVTDLGGARKHYHQVTTEVYHILEGEGQIELDGALHEVRPGTTIYIPAGVAHRAIGSLKAVIATVPPFDASDEYLCDEEP
ncbi:cupin domain-containing protein [bacterium]|nr:cupin domain-containing protein [bacterium]